LINPNEIKPEPITDNYELVYLISENIDNPNPDPDVIYSINLRETIFELNFSLDLLDDKIVKLFKSILDFKSKQYSLKYFDFITFLISQYFSQKLNNTQNPNENIHQEINFITNTIFELIQGKEMNNLFYWNLAKLRYDLIFQQRNYDSIRAAFEELYELFLENLENSPDNIEMKNLINFLLLFGCKFELNGIYYEQFSSIIFLISNFEEIESRSEIILENLTQYLKIKDQINLRNILNFQLKSYSNLKNSFSNSYFSSK
jgi:hypothetical protein